MTDLLTNPIWNSLSTRHSGIALGDSRARRYPEDMGPLSGIPEQSPQCWAALKELIPPGGVVALFLNEPPQLPAGLTVVREFPIHQMVSDAPLQQSSSDDTVIIEALGENDVPEMLALAEATEPGPFRTRTIDFGGYLGIRDQGIRDQGIRDQGTRDQARLVAMAGQRTALPGHREISAVCTWPEYRGRGFAAALVRAVGQEIAAQGELPYLHVLRDNHSAIRVYQRLGFRISRSFHGAVIALSDAV